VLSRGKSADGWRFCRRGQAHGSCRRARGALVSIDAIATNEDIAKAIIGQGADYLLAVKANQPTLRPRSSAATDSPADTSGTPRQRVRTSTSSCKLAEEQELGSSSL
jgi:hypothetical protein